MEQTQQTDTKVENLQRQISGILCADHLKRQVEFFCKDDLTFLCIECALAHDKH
jgi:hypothetical protein